MKKIIFLAALILMHGFSFAQSHSSDENNTVLTITMSQFTGTFYDNQTVELSWKTMMEMNVEYFEVLRSGDGMNFQVLDTVESKMTAATNVYQLEYNFTDKHPMTGTSYYRIEVIGKGGHTNQSPVIQITNNSLEGTKIYPTLVQNNMVYVETDKNLRSVKMEFFDLSGNKISETNWNALNGRENVMVAKSGKLHSGTYVARLSANGVSVKNQLMIIESN